MRQLLTNIDALYTCDSQDRVLHNAYVVTDGERIAEVGEGNPPDGVFDAIFDLAGCIAMPGLVNVHHHFFQTLTRAIPRTQRGNLLEWLRLLYPVWAGLRPDDYRAASAAAAAELLLSGATTTADHAYLVPGCDPDFLEAEIDAASRLGIRLHLVRGAMPAMEANLEAELTPMLGPGAGGLVDREDAVVSDMRRVIRRHHSTAWGARVTIAVGPTTVTYGNLDFMRALADLAVEHGCGLHTHFHPRPDEREHCASTFGRSPIAILDECRWLRPGTWFAHGTRLQDDEIRFLADRGCAVAHCPRMILRLGARITPVHVMHAAGLPLGIGVDGPASNDSASMLAELRLALLLHRVGNGERGVPPDEWLDPYDILHMATRGGAALLGRSDIGRVEVGCAADFAAFDMRAVGYAGARFDLLSALLLAGAEARSMLTMVAGEPRVWKGQLVDADEWAIRDNADTSAFRLVEQASRLTGTDYLTFALRQSGRTRPLLRRGHEASRSDHARRAHPGGGNGAR